MTDDRTSGEMNSLLGPIGPVARAFRARGRAYEERPQQTAMARAVADALSSSRHLVVEAGTGVGKSFAYLVPLLRVAASTSTTVAVATCTIALQEQLVRQDLPLLAEALPFDVSFALVKGRGNYLCLRRLALALGGQGQLFDDADDGRRQLEAIRTWSSQTTEGSVQDLPFRPGPGVWSSVNAERGNCKGRACTFYSRCFYQRSRRRAHEVRCLVLNHHVLMADLALRRSGSSFLPDVQTLVVDEAHDLEDTAAEHLGLRVSSLGAAMLLGRLWSPRRETGLLAGSGDAVLRKQVDRSRSVLRGFFGALEDHLANASSSGDVLALDEGFPVDEACSPRLRELASDLSRSTRAVSDEDVSMELKARARQVEAVADTLEGIGQGREGEVRWMERSGRGVALASAPIAVGPLLREVLWEESESVVLTSATLTTGHPPSFTFLRERLGVVDADDLAVGSPFDYERQARVVVRGDLPDPAREGEAYQDALAGAVLDAVRATKGGAFVLFTGYRSMRRTADAVRDELAGDGLDLLVQGEELERPALIERFREGTAVLFGVASFWQGVDVPGDALRHVVIARLPFEVPTHPLQKARYERLEESGRSSFWHLALPMAALKLKQGFGRLIRSSTDTGRVTVLDPRIVTKRYGGYLMASLPTCPVEVVRAGGEG